MNACVPVMLALQDELWRQRQQQADVMACNSTLEGRQDEQDVVLVNMLLASYEISK